MEPDPALAAVKTYDYLRIALAALVLLLYTSVVLEWGAAGRCLLPSISAYYYTPVHAVFIGVLVTMGVCLVALKGNTDGEDVLMNLAGMLAPGVAFIPTLAVPGCGSTDLLAPDVPAFVTNNMPALFFTAIVVGVVAVVITLRQGGFAGLSTVDRVGAALTVVVLGGGIVWYVVARDSFIVHGHDAAAIPMFLAIIGVVWLNARNTHGRYVAVYRMIAGAMLVALVVTVAVNLATGSSSVVFWVEVVLISLFAVFWLVQTTELWRRGLRGT